MSEKTVWAYQTNDGVYHVGKGHGSAAETHGSGLSLADACRDANRRCGGRRYRASVLVSRLVKVSS